MAKHSGIRVFFEQTQFKFALWDCQIATELQPKRFSERRFAKGQLIEARTNTRRWLAAGFTRIEDIIYVGLGLLLGGVAGSLLITEIIYFIKYLLAGALSENIVMLLDRVLLIVIFVEVLYTVQVSFRQHVLQPGPFLVVGLIAVTRRILVLTAELPKIIQDNGSAFQNAMIELALLTVLVVSLVFSLRLIRPADPSAAARDLDENM